MTGKYISSRLRSTPSRHTTETTHSGHACEIARDLLVEDYDALVTVSGDGLIHEVMNGFAKNANPRRALALPVAPIPTGSGNGLSLNLLGLQVCFFLFCELSTLFVVFSRMALM